jgi:predicted AAA+ superfamily ATPase
MESSHLVFILPPYFQNIRKRVVKSPKIYFTDTGLVSYLLGIETEKQAERDPLRGNLYENLIIVEVMKWFLNQGRDPGLFYYRDTHGNEVDLVCQVGRYLMPIEIKSAATFTPDFTENIEKFRKIAGEKVSGNGFVLYGGETSPIFKGTQILNLFRAEHPLGLLKKSLNV